MISSAVPRLHVLSGPFVSVGDARVPVPEGSKRLVTYCALRRSPVARREVAGDLWPECADARAAGNLRSALWRLRGAGIEVLESDHARVWLRPGVPVDLDIAREWTRRLVEGRHRAADLRLMDWWPAALDLLPGWYDDWILLAREELRARTLVALERLVGALCAVGRTALAIDVAMLAVSHDGLSESAQRALVEAHLADGNFVMAWRAFGRYRDLLAVELGVEPGPGITALVLRADTVPLVPPPRVAPPRTPAPRSPGDARVSRTELPRRPVPAP
jgi:DNA-binding SARP family transcriptional activator